MLGRIIGKVPGLRGRGAPETVSDLETALTSALGLPAVYRPEVVHKDGGARVSGQKHVSLHEIDYGSLTTVGDLRQAIEDAYGEEGLSVRLVSPTDKDGVSERMHLKTLRDAAG